MMAALPKKVVVIDDERTVQATLTAVLQRHGFSVETASNAAQGRRKVEEVKPDIVLLDLGLPDAGGLDVLKDLKAEQPRLAVIILTAHDSLANAIESIKLGAFHFLPKPYAVEELIRLCHLALDQQALLEKNVVLEEEKAQLQVKLRAAEEQLAPVAISRRMREVEELLARVAPSEANVLLTGESGVGKEVFARRIHERSARAESAMVKLNCAAFPANMIEAELFGYAKGAFTGAVVAFPGMLAEADGGTLFLDEITEMPVELQTRFLRVLQEREYRPLGTTKNRPVNFRLVAACNRPPALAVQEGRLRQDLYFRLKTFQVEIPPLRERREDLAKLTDVFLRQFAKQLDKPVPQLDASALELLRAYPWPGNVRELQNAIEHALVLGDGPILLPRHLPREIQTPDLAPATTLRASAPVSLVDAEREALLEALRRTNGNKAQAAQLLGIHRGTIYTKIRQFGLSV
ncbi:MAG: sigma-54 dependent transcriptional regulator [Chthoniobacteraceae bacterium]